MESKNSFRKVEQKKRYVSIRVMDELAERWQESLDCFNRRWRILVPTQVDDYPSNVSAMNKRLSILVGLMRMRTAEATNPAN